MNKYCIILFSALLLGACKTSSDVTGPISSANNFKASFHQGIRNYITGNYNKAIADFESCLKINPLDDAVHFALAQLYLINQQFDKAAEQSELAAKLDPKNTYYIAELAYMYSEMKDHKKSAQFFERLILTDQSNATYYMGAINNYAEIKEYAKALKILNRLIEQNGQEVSLQMEKYRLYELMMKPDLAIKTLEEGRKLFNDDPVFLAVLVDTYMENHKFELAFNLLNDLVEKDPDNGLATLLLGEMYMEKKEYKKGLALLKTAVKKEGPSIDQKMNILIQTQKIEGCGIEVVELVNYMVERYPENEKSYTIQGDCFVKNNEIKSAIEAYQNAVKINPDLFPVWQQILLLEFQSESWNSLYKNSLEALSLYPTNTFVNLTAGLAANKLKKYNEALIYLESGLQFVVKDDGSEAEMMAQMGEANFGLKKPVVACEHFEKALKKAPESATIHASFALQLAKNNLTLDYANKLSDFAISKATDNGLFLAIKGFILLVKLDYLEGLSIMKKAKELDPNNSLILDWLGDAYYFNGKTQEAIIEWTNAIKLGSTNELLPKKIQSKKYYAPTN
jgi:tetratricopeptide (TPR) repeat protein